MRLFLLFLLVFTLTEAKAQDGDYVPPPLFAEPTLPPPKIKKEPMDKLPDLSREVQESKQPPQPKEPIVAPRVIKQVEPAKVAPKEEPEVKSTNNLKQKSAPVPAEKPARELVEEEDSSSIVTGPKTMPSNKKESVEEVLLYEEKEITPLPIQAKAEKEDKKIIVSSEPVEIDQNQYYFTFKPQKSDLSNESIRVLESLIIPAMLQNKGISIEMNAYAAAVVGDSNADRRIALDRGLAIREYFIENGVESYRINLRSHGSNTANQPPDYVEINIKGL